jgi:phosphoglycolate phosphatase
MAIKAIIWDFDGTLASSLEGIFSSMSETLKTYGYPAPTLEEVRATVGLTLEESMRRLSHNKCTDEQIPELVAKYRSLHESNAAPLTKLFNGTQDVLSEIREKGVTSIVVSNKGRDGLNQLIEQLELQRQFDIILSAQDVEYRKPDPRLYSAHIAPLLAVSGPDEVLVVGDTESDIRFAHDAGLSVCWARYGYGDHAVCRGLNPTHTITSITEVMDTIASYS